MAFHQLGDLNFEQQVDSFKKVLRQSRYAPKGARPLGRLTLSLESGWIARSKELDVSESTPCKACHDTHPTCLSPSSATFQTCMKSKCRHNVFQLMRATVLVVAPTAVGGGAPAGGAAFFMPSAGIGR